MPATPTRPPSTRISRRTSSRSVSNNNDDQPSTSTPSSSTPLNLPPPVAMDTEEEVGGRGRSRSNSRGTATTPGRKKRTSAAAAAAAVAPPATTTDELEKEEEVLAAAEKPDKDVEKMESDEKEKEKVQPVQPKKKLVVDKRLAYMLTELLIMNRRERDKLELEKRKIRVADVPQRKAAVDILRPIEGMIRTAERVVYSSTLEEILQNPKYAVISDLVPPERPPEEEEVQPADQPGPSTRTMQPIEVKIEDADGSAAPSTSVLPSTSAFNGETHVERAARREANVLTRIGELRKNGLWSNSRLPKCVEPERNKTHWDYLLEEVRWMAIDFRTETNHKKKQAKLIAVAIAKQHRDKEIEVARAAEREIRDKKKMCAGIARMIKQFWTGVDKFVDVKATEIREARIQKAKNQHLMFMLGQVGELSNVVQEGLVASQSPSIASHEDGDDKEFEAGSDSEDDEQTIANAEKSQKKDDVKKEVDALKDEANADIDDFLFTLPPEYLKEYGFTDEDVQEMKRQKKEQDERRKKEREAPKVVELPDEEPTKEDEKMEVDEEPSAASKPSTSKEKPKQQIQDTSAEDGNGDGRGVLSNVDYLKLNSSNSGERQQELNNIAEEALKFQPKGYTLETTVVNTPVPFLIRGTLREYQLVGLDWMVTLYDKNLNGILADEMGLGKTIQTISLLAHLACSKNIWGPHLIVVPTSVILNWEMEFKKWCPALKILTYFGTAKERAEKRKGWMKPNCFHVCITSYKTVTQDIRSFKQRAWQYLILDEAQNIKNWKSQRWQALLNVRARRRLLLTGTPLQNSLMELWSLMHFLMPTIFSSHDDFKDWFSNPLTGMMDGSVEVNSELIKSLHKVLRPFILRRLKKEVEKQLPAKTEHVIKCSLSKRQRYLYDDFMSRRSTKDNLKSGNMMSVLNIVMQLRKCCNHPNLFEPRPVLAPFVVPKLQVDVPSYLFDIAHQDPEIQEIPEIFNLQKIGYQPQSVGIYSQKKPLVVELEAMQQNVLQEQRIPEVDGFRFNRTAFVTKNPPRVGEESEDEGVRTNGTAPAPKVNGTGVNGAVNGAPSTAAPSARPKTSTSTPLTIQTATSGFHFIMANTGRSRLDESARMSPPLKRAKLTGSSVNWSDYVPQHVLDKMEESRKNQLEVVRRRFGLVRAPIVPLEMVALIREEIMSRFPRLVTDPDEKIQETLMDQVELLVQRFGMYVEPVLTDAWQCRPSSSGLPSYIRQNFADLEKDSHSLLLKSSTRYDTQMAMSRSLQFPELRLIEYDCGKLQTLATLLRQLYAFKHRCLIFTQMSKMLDVLQTFLSHHGYQYFRLDGTTGVEQRQAMMERFNADPKVFCFILSTRSGGVGVNLTGADTVIFYDSDWNPTMDAQAQDRCHRIGQTRDVSIYRLISERTIEENILRKATEKRKLGEVAIDDAGFTPEFFKKSDNIRDLFSGEDVDVGATEDVPMNQKDVDKALARCEDEQDVKAAKIADAEARLDTAEFDERMVATSKSQAEEETNEKFMELIQAMKPIERYAVNLLETQYKPDFEEECKEAEAQIHQKREEWDKNINEALDPEHPDNLLNGDDMFSMDNDFYTGGNAAEMIITNDFDETMPMWLPLSPPNSEFELKMEDDYLDLMYEPELMSEARLPQVTHEVRRPPLAEKPKQNQTLNDMMHSKEKDSVYDAVAKCLQMPKQEPVAASPAYTENSFSMDDSSQEPKIEPLLHMENQQPSGLVMNQMQMMHHQHQMMQQQQRSKKRRNNNSNDLGGMSSSRGGGGGGERGGGGSSGMPPNRSQPDTSVVRRATSPPPCIREEPDYDGAEWNIVEDYALLQSVQQELALGHTVERNSHFPGLQLNWDYVALAVNKQTRFYRSPRQCSIRYQMFVRPKELNQLVASDPITKRNIKVELSTTELAHLRRGRITTESQYAYDYGTLTDKKHLNRFKAVKMASQKRTLSFWRGPKGLESRQLKSLNNGLPANHMNKLRELDVHPGLIRDAEEVLTLPDDKIAELEQQKKALQIRNMLIKTLNPRQESRFHTLVERPYTVPINTELKPMPARREMVIAVPPLQLQSTTVNQHPVIVHQPAAASLAPSTSGPQAMHNSASHPNLQGGGMQADNRGGDIRGDNRGGLGGMHLNQPPHHGGGIGGNHSQAPAHLLNVNNHHHGHQLPPIGTIMQNQHQNQHQSLHHNQNHNQQPTIPIRQISQHGGQQDSQQGPPPPHQQPTIQRRTASVSNVQFLNQQQQGGQGYVVMSGPDGPGGGPQGPPPPSQQAQRVQYVPQGGGRGTYANTVVMQRGGHRVVQRPPGTLPNGGRVYIDQRQYPPNVVPVRVMPAGQGGQAHRVMPTGTRRAPPMPGTVAAMVLPNRNNPGGPQIRTMHFSRRTTNNYPGQQQRINVMVQPQNMRAGGPGGPGSIMAGPGPMRRQIVRPLQRIDNSGPPVAQVVVAPPQGLQTGGGGGGPPMLHVNRPLHLTQQGPPPSQQGPPPQPPSHQGSLGGGGPGPSGPGPSGPGGDGPSTTSKL